jgi:hypothetical protein
MMSILKIPSLRVLKPSDCEGGNDVNKKGCHAEPVEARGQRPQRTSLRQAQTDSPAHLAMTY